MGLFAFSNKIIFGKHLTGVKSDTVVALQNNMEAMNAAVQENLTVMDKAVKDHIKAINTAHIQMDTANTKVVNYENRLKTLLDKRLERSKESISKIFEVDGLKWFIFWLAMGCAILTPIVLVVIFML